MQKNNFLNAQNYILGKTEKKKLLSKFFVEKTIKFFYYFLNLIYSEKYLFFILFIFVWGLVIFLLKIFFLLTNNKINLLWTTIILIIPIFLLYFIIKTIFLYIIKSFEKNKNKKIKPINGIYNYSFFYGILLFPLFLIITFFYIIMKVFFIKGTKGYNFLKYQPQTKIFKKFKILEKNMAKNKYYKISLKL